MFMGESGPLNPNCTLNENDRSLPDQAINQPFLGYSPQGGQKQEKPKPQRYFNSPKIQELLQEAKNFVDIQEIFKDNQEASETRESFEKSTSATIKALATFELEGPDKKKWKKPAKTTAGLKRKKLNQRLSKLLTPKSPVILLHELKPGCVYRIEGQGGCIPPTFFAEVELNGEILGTGQGLSKSQAKNQAAENSIRTIVSRSISKNEEGKEGDAETVEEKDCSYDSLLWSGLASLAMYKLLSEWQSEGTDLLALTRPFIRKKCSAINAPTKKELPPNASELHPAVVLNMVIPGLTAVELEREGVPRCRVKMAYIINGTVFSGVGGNKKDAKKEAAKTVLKNLYGLTYC